VGPRALDAIPRAGLGHWPTPLEPCPRLSDELGVEVWVKREDCSGLGLGGNKVRKLDFLLGSATAGDVVITFGALQSNHARQTAAACARLGLECHLILSPVVPRHDELYTTSGNVLVDRLLGAHLHVTDDPVRTFEQVAAALEGRTTWVIPAGGSDASGALGYVAAAEEWTRQSREMGAEPTVVVVASSTGGTQAGTLVGLKRVSARARVIGVGVYQSPEATCEAVATLAAGAAAELGIGPPAPSAIEVTGEFLGEGYGIPTPEMVKALALFARTEGLVLDPVYSGKAAAALVALARRGDLASERVLFIHTGGAPGLFAYGPGVVDGGG
jgi:D-cysteine desulfhydrase family pyridoxal phosphate-dependent enzyme